MLHGLMEFEFRKGSHQSVAISMACSVVVVAFIQSLRFI